MTEYRLILFFSLFAFTLVQLTALFGQQTILANNPNFVLPEPPTGIIGALFFVVANISIFFQLMTISSEFAFLGIFILSFSVAIFYVVLRLIRGGG